MYFVKPMGTRVLTASRGGRSGGGAETASILVVGQGWPQHPNTGDVGGPAPSGSSPQQPRDSTEMVIEVVSNNNLQ